MYDSTVPHRLLRIDQDMAVGAKTYPSVIKLRPTDGDDLVSPGIKAGQFKINRDQGCIIKFVYMEPGTFFDVGLQAGLPAFLSKFPAPSAQAPPLKHQCTWYLCASAF